ncbi:hypothetical protein BKA62DRAFT_171775 [Auriculariales sp. MPI-PUGE-AT-0066]|nr:hypothetical protein BKA62DRAFT_171775 [Auriculariales sp. MPI-PUGE-AT-0066]
MSLRTPMFVNISNDPDRDSPSQLALATTRSPQLAQQIRHIRWVCLYHSWKDWEVQAQGLATAIVRCTHLRSLQLISLHRQRHPLEILADALNESLLNQTPPFPPWPQLDGLWILGERNWQASQMSSLATVLSATATIDHLWMNHSILVDGKIRFRFPSITTFTGTWSLLYTFISEYDQSTEVQQNFRLPRRINIQDISSFPMQTFEQLESLPQYHIVLSAVRFFKFHSGIPTDLRSVVRHMPHLHTIHLCYHFVEQVQLELLALASPGVRRFIIQKTPGLDAPTALQTMQVLLAFLEGGSSDGRRSLALRLLQMQLSTASLARFAELESQLLVVQSHLRRYCAARRIAVVLT